MPSVRQDRDPETEWQLSPLLENSCRSEIDPETDIAGSDFRNLEGMDALQQFALYKHLMQLI